MPTPAPATLLAGLLFGFSLIVAIGAQNAFVLRQGATRRHVAAVVAICTISDALLIAVGVAGAGALLRGHDVLEIVRMVGAAALLGYGLLAARRALRPGALDPAGATDRTYGGGSRAAAIGVCLAFTWLNPAVYLDTVVLLGSVAGSAHRQRWAFGLGAAAASAIWFAALGFGAGLLRPLLRRPGAWRVLDGFVAIVMAVTAARLLAGGL